MASLRALAPEAFADGKINWSTLQESLGEHLEEEGEEAEHFGLFWPGKRAARSLASMPSRGTLAPMPGEGVSEGTTKNLFIEGDNLEVLKLLQKSYAARIKMIYIDPPYNTGNDFVYHDNFADTLGDYLRRTAQADEEGAPLSTNTRAEGRFHSNWLSMMYPRLRLARALLREDGLLFVSIDDTEVANLRLMLDEIFGAEHFIAHIAWEKRFTRSNNARLFYSLKDSILVYRKSDAVSVLREARTDKANSIYSNPDNDARGPWTSSSYVNPATKTQRPNLVYPIAAPDGRTVQHPTHAWKYSHEEHLRHAKEGRLWWAKKGDAKFPRLKVFLSESEGGLVPIDLWDHKSTGTTDEGGLELKDLFGEAVFDNPKPTRLIRRMLQLVAGGDDEVIVLDFFAGSGSTGHAILKDAIGTSKRLQFILVQWPEPVPETSLAHKSGYRSIADITKERLRRAINHINGNDAPSETEDRGFQVFRLRASNFNTWEDYSGSDPGELTLAFESTASPLTQDWSADSLLTEILLLEGFPLDSARVPAKTTKGNEVISVSTPLCGHRLLICFDKRIKDSTEDGLQVKSEDIFVCFDSALTDEHKLRLADRCHLKTI